MSKKIDSEAKLLQLAQDACLITQGLISDRKPHFCEQMFFHRSIPAVYIAHSSKNIVFLWVSDLKGNNWSRHQCLNKKSATKKELLALFECLEGVEYYREENDRSDEDDDPGLIPANLSGKDLVNQPLPDTANIRE